ncbi:MAG: hypothetical protein JWP10_430 [Nocardioidaceae bacterium]|nr:hypothetical protein [Nocardioidaceae bacterium]
MNHKGLTGAPDLNDPTVPPPVVYTGPEKLFRVRDIKVGESSARVEMDRGDWSSYDGHMIGAGAIGVMADNLTSYAVVMARRPHTWFVSTEITIDTFPGLLSSTSLRGEARLVHGDSVGGFVAADIFDQDSRLVAVATQRARWIPIAASAMSTEAPTIPDIPVGDLGAMLGASLRVDGEDAVLSLNSDPLLQSANRTMQGGISIAAADMVATSALSISGMPALETASLRIGYTRAVMAGSSVEYRAVRKHRGRGLGVVEVTASVAGKTTAVVHIVANPLA